MQRKIMCARLLWVLAVFLVLLMPTGVAEAEKRSGQWKYVLEDDGAMITGYVGKPKDMLSIPDKLGGRPVTAIGAWAFEHSEITWAILPESLIRIGEGAFAGNFIMTAVTIRGSVSSIGDWAFNGCTSLTSVTLPGSIRHIGEGAFEGCGLMSGGLKRVTLPAGLTFIGEGAFRDSNDLTLAVVENSYAEQYAVQNNIDYVYSFIYTQEDPLPYAHMPDSPHAILPSTVGNICDFATINGWTLNRKLFVDDQGEVTWGIFGKPDFSDEDVLLTDYPRHLRIIPCGDSFIYLGANDAGQQRWLACTPGEKGTALPKAIGDVFCGFDGCFWYRERSGSIVYAMDVNGKNKRRIGTVKDNIVGVLGDASIVVANYKKNTVSAWKDGVYSVLYSSPDRKLATVFVVHDSVWVSHGDHFGRIENGALVDRQEGLAYVLARTTQQTVFGVQAHRDAEEVRLLLVNDATRSYTYLGSVPYAPGSGMELYPHYVVYWGNGRHAFAVPSESSAWTRYAR